MAIRELIDKSLQMDHEGLINKYQARPMRFLTDHCGRVYPSPHRLAFEAIYNGRVQKAAILANRGGGKSMLMADLAACLYLFKRFDVFILGGSEDQAKKCYQYAAEALQIDARLDDFNADVGKILARSVYGNWIAVAAASGKRVRGPHCGDPHREMGMERHGGCLIYDEECEIDDEISDAAKYTINTAHPAVWVRASTLHKTVGRFSELCGDPAAKGFELFSWNCFDTAEYCDRDCRVCRPDFSGRLNPDFERWKTMNPDFIQPDGYCRGKAKKGIGWRKIWGLGDPGSIEGSYENTFSREEFEIEELGLRPATGGLVLDPQALARCLKGEAVYLPGMPGLIVIDWGMKGWTALHVIQRQKDGVVVVLQTEYYHNVMDEAIFLRVKCLGGTYGIGTICADASHPFQNAQLRFNGFKVNEVQFNQWKDMGVGWIKGLVERGQLWLQGSINDGKEWYIDGQTKRFYEELKGWRRGNDGRIVKKDDHGPDALLCGVMEWGARGPWKAEWASTGARESVRSRY